jgi:hypothetical protein
MVLLVLAHLPCLGSVMASVVASVVGPALAPAVGLPMLASLCSAAAL